MYIIFPNEILVQGMAQEDLEIILDVVEWKTFQKEWIKCKGMDYVQYAEKKKD